MIVVEMASTLYSYYLQFEYKNIWDSCMTSSTSFREIQEALVEIGDKDDSFIGSREWIGAIELSFVLDKLLGVSSYFMKHCPA